jgi:hypothetical protein
MCMIIIYDAQSTSYKIKKMSIIYVYNIISYNSLISYNAIIWCTTVADVVPWYLTIYYNEITRERNEYLFVTKILIVQYSQRSS